MYILYMYVYLHNLGSCILRSYLGVTLLAEPKVEGQCLHQLIHCNLHQLNQYKYHQGETRMFP